MTGSKKQNNLEPELQRYRAAAKTTRTLRRKRGVRDWAAYTAAAGSACALAPAADAAVIYSGVQNISVTRTGTGTFLQEVDLNGDGKLDVVTANRSGNNVSVILHR
jgi:hypothetical protein